MTEDEQKLERTEWAGCNHIWKALSLLLSKPMGVTKYDAYVIGHIVIIHRSICDVP